MSHYFSEKVNVETAVDTKPDPEYWVLKQYWPIESKCELLTENNSDGSLNFFCYRNISDEGKHEYVNFNINLPFVPSQCWMYPSLTAGFRSDVFICSDSDGVLHRKDLGAGSPDWDPITYP